MGRPKKNGPSRKKMAVKTTKVSSKNQKIDFVRACTTIQETLHQLVSDEMLQITHVDEIKLFLEKLTSEIDLQKEILEHTVAIKKLREETLMSGRSSGMTKGAKGGGKLKKAAVRGTSAKVEKRGRKKGKQMVIDEEWMDETPSMTHGVRAVKEEFIVEREKKKRGRKPKQTAEEREIDSETPLLFDQESIQ